MLKKIYFQAEVIQAAAKHLYCHGASLSLPYFPTMTGCNYSNQKVTKVCVWHLLLPHKTQHEILFLQ